MQILIVEDQDGMRQAVASILEQNNYIVDQVDNGIDGLDYAVSGIYDLIILDIMMPGMNGIDVLRNLRSKKISTPVLLLTSKSSVADKVRGLDTGADDYLTKPFALNELLARVRALSRRKGEIESDVQELAGLTLDNKTGELSYGESSIPLGLKELKIMQLLLKNKGQLLSKELLIERVWGFDTDADNNNVEVYISYLRKKIALLNAPVEIKTSRGIGYSIRKKPLDEKEDDKA